MMVWTSHSNIAAQKVDHQFDVFNLPAQYKSTYEVSDECQM